MKFKWVLIISGLSVLIIASAFGIKYLKTSKKPIIPVQNNVQTTPSPFPTSQSGESIIVPFPVSAPDVKLAGITYTLQGQVRSIVKSSSENQWRMVLEGAGGAYFNNPFFITEKTLITGLKDKTKVFKVQDIKDKDAVEINYYFNLKTKDGFVTTIRLTDK